MELCVFEASLVYRESSRTTKAMQRNPVSKTKTKQHKTRVSLKSEIKTDELSQMWQCTPSVLAEAGGSLWFLSQCSLHSNFQVSQAYIWRPCLKKLQTSLPPLAIYIWAVLIGLGLGGVLLRITKQ